MGLKIMRQVYAVIIFSFIFILSIYFSGKAEAKYQGLQSYNKGVFFYEIVFNKSSIFMNKSTAGISHDYEGNYNIDSINAYGIIQTQLQNTNGLSSKPISISMSFEGDSTIVSLSDNSPSFTVDSKYATNYWRKNTGIEKLDICDCLTKPGDSDFMIKNKDNCNDLISRKLGVDNWEKINFSKNAELDAKFNALTKKCN